MAKAKAQRIKKGPDIEDFVVETIDRVGGKGLVQTYKYFSMRSEARNYAKNVKLGGKRARVFHIHYALVGDTK